MIQEAHPLKQGLKRVPADVYDYLRVNKIQEAHPLKQGLKLVCCVSVRSYIRIQEAHPLKQGLKPIFECAHGRRAQDSRGASTKTRIETLVRLQDVSGSFYSRGASTKTRIETMTLDTAFCKTSHSRGASTKTRIETTWLIPIRRSAFIQEAHPLKQGLKLPANVITPIKITNSRGASTKTRIETIV